MQDKTVQLRDIRDEVLRLKASPLYRERVKNKVFPVIGEGSHDAAIMLVGEAPGKNEAEQGRPFCGAAGRVLDELLASADIPRKEVYITNIVKDRPPMNRDPLPEEIAIYTPFLDRQIEIIRPRVIATLGRFSMQYIMQKFGLTAELATISRIHGRVFSGQAPYGAITIIPFFHPAMALYNGSSKAQMLEDFKVLKEFYRSA
ncbi:MAG: uracil-DNA glycosylase [Candidatus Sungbacteria bacterium]|nr:uracil-DNA glycosylase [Candidatus Sungbacteria bacterium]